MLAHKSSDLEVQHSTNDGESPLDRYEGFSTAVADAVRAMSVSSDITSDLGSATIMSDVKHVTLENAHARPTVQHGQPSVDSSIETSSAVFTDYGLHRALNRDSPEDPTHDLGGKQLKDSNYRKYLKDHHTQLCEELQDAKERFAVIEDARIFNDEPDLALRLDIEWYEANNALAKAGSNYNVFCHDLEQLRDLPRDVSRSAMNRDFTDVKMAREIAWKEHIDRAEESAWRGATLELELVKLRGEMKETEYKWAAEIELRMNTQYILHRERRERGISQPGLAGNLYREFAQLKKQVADAQQANNHLTQQLASRARRTEPHQQCDDSGFASSKMRRRTSAASI